MSDSREYVVWQGIKSRCNNPKNTGYLDYGGRGIRVCDRWEKSFTNFLADVGRKPSALHSLDRIDNDGNYEPSNCRWANKREQGRNTRRNVWFEFDGQRLTLAEISERSGISYKNLHQRISRGKTVADAIAMQAASPRERIEVGA